MKFVSGNKEDQRQKYKIGSSVREAVYQRGGVRCLLDGDIPRSSLYKYIGGQQKYILKNNAYKFSKMLGLKPILKNGIFEVDLSIKTVIIKYCFNCGNKIKENTDG